MELISNWFSENQTLLVGYSIKLIAAIAIFVVGQFIAKIIKKIIAKILNKRGVDLAVISFVASLT